MIDGMKAHTRKKLMQLACIAAWADLEIQDEERTLILALAAEMELGPEDTLDVKLWLVAPPPELDPYDIPPAYRKTFLDTVQRVFEADGRVDLHESTTFELLQDLLL